MIFRAVWPYMRRRFRILPSIPTSTAREKEMTKIALRALDDKKAMDVKVIDIHEVSVLADYFVIASGSNQNQVQAMVDNVEEMLTKAGYEPKQIEGTRIQAGSLWIRRSDHSCI